MKNNKNLKIYYNHIYHNQKCKNYKNNKQKNFIKYMINQLNKMMN